MNSSTALKEEEEKKEYFDSPEEFEEKITLLAKWIKESKYFTAFTGGSPDFVMLISRSEYFCWNSRFQEWI